MNKFFRIFKGVQIKEYAIKTEKIMRIPCALFIWRGRSWQKERGGSAACREVSELL